MLFKALIGLWEQKIEFFFIIFAVTGLEPLTSDSRVKILKSLLLSSRWVENT